LLRWGHLMHSSSVFVSPVVSRCPAAVGAAGRFNVAAPTLVVGVGSSCVCFSGCLRMLPASRHFVGYRRVATALLLFVSPVVSGIVTRHHCCGSAHANATKGPISIGLQRLPHVELGRWHSGIWNRFSSCLFVSPVHSGLRSTPPLSTFVPTCTGVSV
jgi:hypothetical protein